MDQTLANLKSQLVQLEQQHATGGVAAPEYQARKAALERQLLDQVLAAQPPESREATPKPSRGLVAMLSAGVIVVALAGYAWTGSPFVLGIGTAPAGSAAGAPADASTGDGAAAPSITFEQIAEMTERLATRLKNQPQDAAGWAMLGRAYSVLGRNAEAIKAYETAVEQRGDDAALLADYADALAVKNNRTLAGEPMRWIRRALELDARNVKALSLAGTEAFERQDYATAVKYWEQVLEVGPKDANFIQQVNASVAEARQRGGLAAVPRQSGAVVAPSEGGAVVAQAPVQAPAQAPTSGATISGTVSLNPALAGKAGSTDTVFIFARAAEGPRVPLAVLRKQVKDLPLRFTLDDSLAMSPAAKLSGASQVIVSARVSKSGNAMPASGDLVGQVGPVPVGSSGLAIEIGEQVKP
jgi:cytochrome c-type biogenesis protein CcmH